MCPLGNRVSAHAENALPSASPGAKSSIHSGKRVTKDAKSMPVACAILDFSWLFYEPVPLWHRSVSLGAGGDGGRVRKEDVLDE